MLFELDLTGGEPAVTFASFWAGQSATPEELEFAERLVLGVYAERDALDGWITASAEHWRLERMAVVDRNVLRLGLWEMLHERETPLAVVIDEAIEIAKRYGGDESGAFVNGVLDALRRRVESGAAPAVSRLSS